MSVTTTSGRSASTAASSDGGRRTRQRPRGRAASRAAPYAFADEVVILREHEPDRHGERICGDVFASRCARAGRRAREPARADRRRQREEPGSPATCYVLPGSGRWRQEPPPRGSRSATEHLPDVILMDLQLPDMDGTDAAQSLADGTRTARIPVVALSAHRSGDDDRFSSPRFAAYLQKPIDVGAFAEQVRDLCAGPGG